VSDVLCRDVSLCIEIPWLNLVVNFGNYSTKFGESCAGGCGSVPAMTLNIVLYHRDKVVLGLSSDLAQALLYTNQ
jgi:hypothetical protein